jgi:hypothetical protein
MGAAFRGKDMLSKNHIPSHPGEILQEHFLEPLGLTQVALSEHLGEARYSGSTKSFAANATPETA